jgi:hypothetical protein
LAHLCFNNKHVVIFYKRDYGWSAAPLVCARRTNEYAPLLSREGVSAAREAGLKNARKLVVCGSFGFEKDDLVSRRIRQRGLEAS